jgi:hypothetical protein
MTVSRVMPTRIDAERSGVDDAVLDDEDLARAVGDIPVGQQDCLS